MFNASFFAAYRAPIDSDGFAPGENLTMVAHAAKSKGACPRMAAWEARGPH